MGGGSPLAKAVYAPAVLTLRVKEKIQHFEGGIVSKVLISEGEYAKKGQLLIQLDPCKQKLDWLVLENS